MRPVRLTGSPSLICLEVAEQHGADAVFFEVQRDAEDAVRELEHLAGHRPLDAVHARDAVADRDDGADFGDVDLDGVAADLVANDLGDFFRSDVHRHLPVGSRPACGPVPALPLLAVAGASSSWVATLPSYTVLPMRATTPPMSAGSTLVVIVTRAAGRRGEPLLQLRRALRRQRRGCRDLGADDLLMLHQPLAVDRRRRSGSSASRSRSASISSSLRDRASTAPARSSSSATTRALAAPRERRIGQRLLQLGMPANEVGERGRARCSACSGLDSLMRDVEQRSRVSARGSPRAHDSRACRDARTVQTTELVPERHKQSVYTTERARGSGLRAQLARPSPAPEWPDFAGGQTCS